MPENPKISISDRRTRVLGPADQPFNISDDSILAFALYMALVPFYDDDWPCVNYYTPEMLRDLGYKGLKPQEAAIMATNDGNKGIVTYMFRQPESELVNAFADEKKLIESSDDKACDRVKALMEAYKAGARSYGETIVRVMAVSIYMRAEFVTMWQKFQSLIQLETPVRKSERKLSDGSRVVESTGFKFIGMNAGSKVKERLGR